MEACAKAPASAVALVGLGPAFTLPVAALRLRYTASGRSDLVQPVSCAGCNAVGQGRQVDLNGVCRP
jgi:hypothetical protein